MREFIRNYFTFNKRDRNALLIIICTIALAASLPYIYNRFHKEEVFDFTPFKEDIMAFELEQKRINEEDSLKKLKEKETFNYYAIDQSVEKSKLNPFLFNPNNLPAEQWRKLGLSDKQINGIKNYEAKGGSFQTKNDLKKMYVISENESQILEPFIDLPIEKPVIAYTPKYTPPVTLQIELNNADSTELKNLKGIGNVLSKRIVSYRNKLGGFCKKEQLLEIEGIDSALYKSIIPQLTLEKRLIKQIDINTAEYTDFKGHPYISSNVALSIINYRRMHGPYKELTDVMKSALMTEELFYKIAPYLTLTL